jgi:hypothetical protein
MRGILSVHVTGDAPRRTSSIDILTFPLLEGEKYSTTQSVTALAPEGSDHLTNSWIYLSAITNLALY